MVNGTCDSQMNLICFLKAVIHLENVLVFQSSVDSFSRNQVTTCTRRHFLNFAVASRNKLVNSALLSNEGSG